MKKNIVLLMVFVCLIVFNGCNAVATPVETTTTPVETTQEIKTPTEEEAIKIAKDVWITIDNFYKDSKTREDGYMTPPEYAQDIETLTQYLSTTLNSEMAKDFALFLIMKENELFTDSPNDGYILTPTEMLQTINSAQEGSIKVLSIEENEIIVEAILEDMDGEITLKSIVRKIDNKWILDDYSFGDDIQ